MLFVCQRGHKKPLSYDIYAVIIKGCDLCVKKGKRGEKDMLKVSMTAVMVVAAFVEVFIGAGESAGR